MSNRKRFEVEGATRDELRQDIEASTRAAVERALKRMQSMLEAFTDQAYLQKTWLTLEEAARYADISTKKLRDWREEGLRQAQVNGRVYIKRDDLDEWISRHAS